MRTRNIEHVEATNRLSGAKPSAQLRKLLEQYRAGEISSAEMVARAKLHYQIRPEVQTDI
ncbi:antitoxin VbhA family protein [Pseudomonas aeruginosa]|uniref:Antitoxin VbhA domain-containing protein n=1 Tax=Pseudomonas fluorescens TaxID=294 RepID=A0A3S4RLT5_PSEFL|nr:antitoxin VbhA family protein [Pseudomonas aeruginosa]VEE50058.1 Uncharacterised protein [Pseudomonas fluorescens]HBN9860908.1 antitoxin VbhA family protein [Pseudomonas aeruginosa]HBN9886125.1 antitoxin VbhA family protein [Pseudomonas aeruginosa]